MNTNLIKSFKADGAIAPNLIIKLTTTGVNVANLATVPAIGISYPEVTTATGWYGDIIISGIAAVTAGGGIEIGDLVATNANGKAIKTTTDGDFVVGQALEKAEGENEIINIALSTFKY